jgi:hypothetical protein
MSRVYVVGGENGTLGTGSVLLAMRTAADGVTAGGQLAIRRIEVFQNASTTSGQCRAEVFKRDTAGTLTMTSVTPQPLSPIVGPASAISGSTAPAGTAARVGFNSSADSGGTYVSIYQVNFNNLNGWLWVPTPTEVIEIPPATVWGVRFIANPTGTTGWGIAVTYEELA